MIVTPLDVIRVRQQTLPLDVDRRANLIFPKRIHQLWSGLGVSLVQSVPSTVVYMLGYEFFMSKFRGHDEWAQISHRELFGPMISGGLARSISSTVCLPLELYKIRLQQYKPRNTELSRDLPNNSRSFGTLNFLKSQWRGLGVTLIRDVPFSAIYWTGYELIKSFIYRNYREKEFKISDTLFISFIAGSSSGSLAAILTTPADVLKSRMQMINYTPGHQVSNFDKLSFRQVIQETYLRQGIKGFMVGWQPRIIRVSLSCGLMIGCYEGVKHFRWKARVLG